MNFNVKIVVAGRLPGPVERQIRDEFPGTTLALCQGDAERLRAEIVDADIVCGRVSREQFLLARRLRLIHNTYVGVETMCFPEMRASAVVITNSRGVHSRPMAEHIMAMTLALYRKLPAMWDAQREARWAPLPREQFSTLHEKTVGLLGTGSIGEVTAGLFRAFGCHTIGYNSSGRPADAIETIYTPGALDAFLADSDVIVNSLPYTAATHHLIGATQFRAMKRSATLINVGRGRTTDESALFDALRDGVIAGAGLDVFAVEPLPAESPLWGLPNVMICPHQSCEDVSSVARMWELALENLRRYRDGRPLLNVVDKDKGY